MKIPDDKIKHLQGGAAIALALLAIVTLGRHVGLWAAVAAGSTAAGIGIELYQRWRHEGEPSWADALASALPGIVLSGGLWSAGM